MTAAHLYITRHPALKSTDEEVARLIATARRDDRWANLIDSACACLWASDREDALSAAEDIVDAATKIRDGADADLTDSLSKWRNDQ